MYKKIYNKNKNKIFEISCNEGAKEEAMFNMFAGDMEVLKLYVYPDILIIN
ncbi:hypothetical protein ABSA28_00882 [Candidatus Hepatincolaceae symbiont of Richtersius coronifer]